MLPGLRRLTSDRRCFEVAAFDAERPASRTGWRRLREPWRREETPRPRPGGQTDHTLAGALVKQSQDRRGIAVGQGLENGQQSFVAGGSRQRVDHLDGQPRARGKKQLKQRWASRIEPPARRATTRSASGSASTCSLVQISFKLFTMASDVIPAKSNRWRCEAR